MALFGTRTGVRGGTGTGSGGGNGVDSIARARVTVLEGMMLTVGETIGPGVYWGSNALWENPTADDLTVPTTINTVNLQAAGFTLFTGGANSTTNNKTFIDDTALAPIEVGTPTSTEFQNYITAEGITDTLAYYTGTDVATDEATYVYQVDSTGDILPLLLPLEGASVTLSAIQRIGNSYRPSELVISTTPEVVVTGLDLTRTTGWLRMQFTDDNNSTQSRPWPIFEVDLAELNDSDYAYVWNHNTSFIEVAISNAATGELTITGHELPVRMIYAEVYDQVTGTVIISESEPVAATQGAFFVQENTDAELEIVETRAGDVAWYGTGNATNPGGPHHHGSFVAPATGKYELVYYELTNNNQIWVNVGTTTGGSDVYNGSVWRIDDATSSVHSVTRVISLSEDTLYYVSGVGGSGTTGSIGSFIKYLAP